MTVFQTKNGTVVNIFNAVATDGDDSDLYDTSGSTTGSYQNSGADPETFIKTDLSSVDHAEVTVAVNDGGLSTSDIGVSVTDARPAEPSDFDTEDDYVDGSVIFTLADEDGSAEIADGTTLHDTALELTVTAYNT